MDAEAMIMIMDYKDYQGEERPVLIAFKHGLNEEKCWILGKFSSHQSGLLCFYDDIISDQTPDGSEIVSRRIWPEILQIFF